MKTYIIALLMLAFAGERDNSLAPAKEAEGDIDITDGCSFTLQIDEPLLRGQLREEHPDWAETVIETVFGDIARTATDRATDIVRTRLNLADIRCVITRDSVENRIHVQFPTVTADVASYAETLSRQNGHLEFRLVHENNRELSAQALTAEEAPPGYVHRQIDAERYFGRATNYAELSSESGYASLLARFGVPQDEVSTMMFMQKTRVKNSTEDLYQPVYVNRHPVAELSEKNLRKVEVSTDTMYGHPEILIEFDRDGAKIFARMTIQNMGCQLAIIMDGIVFAAPKIYAPITGGKAVISGSGFTPEEANMLSIALRSGSLTAPFKVIDRQTSPSESSP